MLGCWVSSAANARLSACMCTDADWLAVGPSHFPRPAPLAGSVKEGAARDPKYDYGEDEELHVLITGDRQEDVSACWGACCTPCATLLHRTSKLPFSAAPTRLPAPPAVGVPAKVIKRLDEFEQPVQQLDQVGRNVCYVCYGCWRQ